MGVDVLSAMLRGVSFVSLLQATGGALFLTIFDPRPRRASIVRLIRWSAIGAIALLTAQYLTEAARMSGEYAGAFDGELQSMVAHSSLLAVYLLRVFGIVLLLSCIRVSAVPPRWIIVVATIAVVLSFALTGHTAARPYNPLLSLVLMVHVAVVAFWFGSLLPLVAINEAEDRGTVAIVVERFSKVAVRIVPALFVTGVVLIAALFSTTRTFLEPYGLILLGKVAAFATLMGLAALNRWRLGPQLSRCAEVARAFSRAVLVEYALMVAVLVATATLTTFFSPGAPDTLAAVRADSDAAAVERGHLNRKSYALSFDAQSGRE